MFMLEINHFINFVYHFLLYICYLLVASCQFIS